MALRSRRRKKTEEEKPLQEQAQETKEETAQETTPDVPPMTAAQILVAVRTDKQRLMGVIALEQALMQCADLEERNARLQLAQEDIVAANEKLKEEGIKAAEQEANAKRREFDQAHEQRKNDAKAEIVVIVEDRDALEKGRDTLKAEFEKLEKEMETQRAAWLLEGEEKEREVSEFAEKFGQLRAERDAEIATLDETIAAKQKELEELNATVEARKQAMARITQITEEAQQL